MVTAAYNSYLRQVQDGFVKALQSDEFFANQIGVINNGGNENTREEQFDYIDTQFKASIGDEYGWKPGADDWTPFKAPNKLIESNMELKRRFVEGGEKEAAAIQQWMFDTVGQHSLVRDEFLLLGDARLVQFNALGAKVSNANSTISKPSSCESTPGTTESITAAPFGGARTTMAAQVLDATIRKLFVDKINTETGKRLVRGAFPILCVAHPIYLGYLDTAMYDGSAYLSMTNKEYLTNRGWRFIASEIADSDYAGADDGTTTIHCFADPERLFKLLVRKAGQWDNGGEWWEDENKTVYKQRFSEILSGVAIPFGDDDGYYYKGYLEATVKGYDSA